MKHRDLARIVARSLEKLDLADRVAAALPAPPRSGARLVAVGKAAAAMAAGAIAQWGDAFVEALVVSPDDDDGADLDGIVERIRAGHPVPDGHSVEAGRRALGIAARCAADGRPLLVLVSGGASALLCAPAPGLSLRDKQQLTRAMLASGASIQEINVVRKHLSRIKGGGLARAAAPARVTTLVASDVIGGTAADVGSGPSVADPSTVASARRLLRRFVSGSRFVDFPLVRTGEARNAKRARLIASPEELARVACRELRARGLTVRLLPPSQKNVDALAREYIERARALAEGPPGTALVRAAEPAVVLPAIHGVGGRSTQLATLVLAALPPGVVFMAAATDGTDGSGTAGAIVDASARAKVSARAIERALARFDTGRLHLRMGTALPQRPAGHNLADLHVLVR